MNTGVKAKHQRLVLVLVSLSALIGAALLATQPGLVLLPAGRHDL